MKAMNGIVMRIPNLLVLLTSSSVLLTATAAHATWPHDPYLGNVAVCTATGQQTSPTTVSDGAGGAVISWLDGRGPTGYYIYAQRVTATGAALWAADGVAVSTMAVAYRATSVSDGAGGAIITWEDRRNGNWDIYAQRVSAAGTPQWSANDVALCTAPGDQYSSKIVSDGAGGAIVAWTDLRGVDHDIYAQRVDAAGTPQWATDGVAVCVATVSQGNPAMVSDGAGGAIIAWSDARSGTSDVWAQRVNSIGSPEWAADGIALCTEAGDQGNPEMVSDGASEAIVLWYDDRNGDSDVYAQKVNVDGVRRWMENGVAVCTAAGSQSVALIASDGAGGAIAAWVDRRAGSGNGDIYVQRMNAVGTAQWAADGVALCTDADDQFEPAIVSDGGGGAIVAWWDYSDRDIYAQKVNAAGTSQWQANGVAVSLAPGDQHSVTLVPDGAGGAILAWEDGRSHSSSSWDVYTQRIERFGYMGPEPNIASVRDVPNDQGGLVKVAWHASWLDAAFDPNLSAYDVYRSAPGSVAHAAVASGAHIVRTFAEVPQPGARTFVLDPSRIELEAWEYLATIPVTHFLSVYGYIAPTTGDSLGGSNPYTEFMVVGRNSSGSMFWLSEPDSGYSVDNIAPSAPTNFTGQFAGGTARLHWDVSDAPDFATFRLYRGATPDFIPGAGNLIVTQTDISYVDPAGSLYYYKLSAVDVHGNAGPYATTQPTATDVSGSLLPPDLTLGPPTPNPLSNVTRLRLALPGEAEASLSVYDQRGRRVRTLLAGTLSAGERSITWDGLDSTGRAVASGVYYVRLTQGANVRVQRVTVLR